MTAKRPKVPQSAAQLPSGYGELLADLKARIHSAQVKAALAVNRELVLLYWQIGHAILQRQRQEGWGARVQGLLTAWLKTFGGSFPI
jgi:hypothetical protein